MPSDLTWETLETEQLADCKIFRVHRERKKHGHRVDDFYVLTSSDWVNIIPLTPDGEVVMIEQYRYGCDAVTLEVPGGIMNPGEEPPVSARREMIEETGYDTKRIEPLGMNEPNPAFLRNRCYSFLALDACATAETRFDEHENIRVRLVPLARIPGMIRDGIITHSLVIVAFHALSLRTHLLPSHVVYQ